MNLILIRHAHAQPSSGEEAPDADRPLSDKGREQCAALARALQRAQVTIGCIVTSPLLRARQTTEELLKHWPAPTPEVHTCEALAPDGRQKKLNRFLRSLSAAPVALVGHMPDLGRYAGWLIGSKKVGIVLAKAGAAYIECTTGPSRGAGSLSWLVTPDWYS
jgi:phosphohistidine phosphatase